MDDEYDRNRKVAEIRYNAGPLPADNQPPIIDAGPDLEITKFDEPVLMAMTADGTSGTATNLTASWTVLEGPGEVHFNDPTLLRPRARFSALGKYVLACTVSDGELSRTDTITVTKGNLDTSFAIRTYEALGFSNQAWYGTSGDSWIDVYTDQIGKAWIDIESEALGGLYFTTREIDPGIYFDAKSGIHWPDGGQILFELSWPWIGDTLTDLEIMHSEWDDWTAESFWFKFTLRFQGEVVMQGEVRYRAPAEEVPNKAPTVHVSPGLLCKPGAPTTLFARADDDLRPFGIPLTTRWEQVAGPATVTFGGADRLQTEATFPQVGTYQLRVTVSDSEFTDSEEVTVYVVKNPRAFSRGLDASAREYAGAVQRGGLPVGYLRALVNPSGSFTAQLWFGGRVHRYKGTLIAGAWTPFDDIDLRLRFAFSDDGEALECTLSNFTWEERFVAREVAPLVLSKSGGTADRAGAYTFMLTPPSDVADSDTSGVGRITVTPSGYFKVTGVLMNGTKFSAAGPMAADESFAWVSKGVSGFVEARKSGEQDQGALIGSFAWQPLIYSYEPGEPLQLWGSAYQPPAAGQNALTLKEINANTLGEVITPWEHWAELVLTLDLRHRLSMNPWVRQLDLVVQPETGLFHGTYRHQGHPRLKIRGALFQDRQLIRGFAIDRKLRALVDFQVE